MSEIVRIGFFGTILRFPACGCAAFRGAAFRYAAFKFVAFGFAAFTLVGCAQTTGGGVADNPGSESALEASLTSSSGPESSQASDRHSGYYYPAPQTRETYVARVDVSPQASRRTRVAFVTSLTKQQSEAAAAPSFHLFAKGDGAQKFILTSVDTTRYRTLYQFRALLAAMTAFSRTTPIFQNSSAPENLTFLDLCKLMGVTQLTLTDGVSVAHQIMIE